MRYLKLTFQYLKKHWISLLAYSFVPALILTFTARPTNVFKFFVNFGTTDYSSFSAVFGTLTQLTWGTFFLYVAVCVICAMFIAAMSGAIERDMRLGEFSNKRFFRRVNQNFITCFTVLFTFFIFMEIFGILCSSFLFLWCKALNDAAALALSLLTAAILLIILAVIYVYFLLWYPVMVISGYRIGNSLSQSIRLVKGHFWKLVASLIVFVIPEMALVFIGVFFDVKYLYILNVIPFTFFIMYIVPLMFVSYFDIAGLEREDLKQKPFWLKGEENGD